MIEQLEVMVVDGQKYEIYTDCMTTQIHHVRRDGTKEQLHHPENVLRIESVIRLHASNLNGKCP